MKRRSDASRTSNPRYRYIIIINVVVVFKPPPISPTHPLNPPPRSDGHPRAVYFPQRAIHARSNLSELRRRGGHLVSEPERLFGRERAEIVEHVRRESFVACVAATLRGRVEEGWGRQRRGLRVEGHGRDGIRAGE